MPTASTFTLAPGIEGQPAIRHLLLNDLSVSLREGWADFMEIPTQLAFLGVIYPVVGLLAARVANGGQVLPLFFPLVAGLSLLGPVLAVGLYELSRRREAGLPVSWRNAFDVFRSPALPAIAALGVMLLVLFCCWIASARLIYIATIGETARDMAPGSLSDFIELIQGSPHAIALIVLGNLAGAAFAAIVLTVSAVSFPMVLDRHVSPRVAVETSFRVVRANPRVMALWGLTVVAVLALGSIPLFVGLAIAMPVLGHATWHLYRRAVN